MGQESVKSFIDRVNANKAKEQDRMRFQNSDFYKDRVLTRGKEECKGHCVKELFKKTYKDALPLSAGYKVSNDAKLDDEMDSFLTAQFPEGIDKVVAERSRSNPVCKRIMEGVEAIATDDYLTKFAKMDKTSADSLAFQASDVPVEKIDVLSDNTEMADLSAVIADHVKGTVQSEVSRSLNEKRTMKEIESELENDMNITTEESVQSELRRRGYAQATIFQPSLFQGIMMGKIDESRMVCESGDAEVSLYNATEPLGREIEENYTVEDRAFVESVKEYTMLSIMKACRLKEYTPFTVERLANSYASKQQ